MFGQQDARIFHFMAEREDIVAEVVERVVRDRVTRSHRGKDQSLEYVLNEAAFLEMQRLERGSSSLDLHPYGFWQDIARKVGQMGEVDKARILRQLTAEYGDDVAGRFTPAVYKFATRVLPVGLGTLFNVQNLDTLHEALRHPTLASGWGGAKRLSERVILSGEVERWRRLTEQGTIIVVPTHSSNLDSLAVGWALHEAGLPPVTYGAGKNLFTSPITSFFMHNLGAYKVDRRIRHTLYKDVLKTYSEVLLERGYHSLFFPGGTRSRSNQVESKLKLGLLGTGLTAYARNLQAGKKKPDVWVCPLTINYHLVLEGETLCEDALRQDGGHRYIIEDDEFSHPGKVASFLYKTMSLEYTVYLRFGEPVDLFGNPVDDEGHSRDPRGRPIDTARYLWGPDGHVREDPLRDAEFTRQCGLAVAQAFRRNTVAVSTAVAALAAWRLIGKRYPEFDLFQRLRVARGERLPTPELAAEVDEVQQGLRKLEAAGGIHLGHEVRSLDALALTESALRLFGMYHSAPVLAHGPDGIEVGHPRLLWWYANRLSSFDLSTARP